MAIQLRSLFPLAVPGMLALLGWWWFFSRKKEHSSTSNIQVKADAKALGATHVTEKETSPGGDMDAPVVSMPLSVTLPEKELSHVGKPLVEAPALLRAQPVCRRSESSGSLPSTTDTRCRPGIRKDDSAQVELVLTGDEAKSIPRECHLPASKAVSFPHEAAEMCKRESLLSRTSGQGQQSQPGAPTEKHAPGEKARERGGTEGTGDAMLPGENVMEEGMLNQELQSIRVPGLAPSGGGGGGEKGQSHPLTEEDAAGKLLSSFLESAHAELGKDDESAHPELSKAEVPALLTTGGRTRDRDVAGKPGLEKTLDKNEAIEQAAFQLISKVILEATEEVLATTVGKITGQVTTGQLSGLEERCTLMGQQTPALQEAAASLADPALQALPSPALEAEAALLPKTYVSCLTSPLGSPTKDKKPKTSVHHISLTPSATPLGELPNEDSGCVTCTSDNSHGVPSVASGQFSDSVSTSGLDDSYTETSSSPRDKANTPPLLPERTVPFSNGVLKGLSDLGTEDGWPPDAEADHSGGRKALGLLM